MVTVTRPVRFEVVLSILQRKDYGVQTMARFALALNRPTGRKFDSGSFERKMVGRGLTREELDAILTRSETEEEAAERIENAILGKEPLPIDEVNASMRGDSISTGLMERMVTNRVIAEVEKAMAALPAHVEAACKPYVDQMLGVIGTVKELLAKDRAPGPAPVAEPEPEPEVKIDGRTKEGRALKAKLAAAKVSAELA